MTQPQGSRASEGGIQFDKAEPGASSEPTSCFSCKRPIEDEYFRINQQAVCPACRDDAALALSTGGSGTNRLGGALLWGGLAALAGAVVWGAFTLLTGYEFALIAIGVGLLVGAGVRKGAQRQGGTAYQVLAVVLCYLSITLANMAIVHHAIVQQFEGPDATAQTAEEAEEMETEAGTRVSLANPAYDLAIFWIALRLPFLDLPGGIIGLLIVAFALWEAWKMNKRLELEILGPYRANPPPPQPAPAG